MSRQSSSFCQEPIRATFEQLSLQKAAFDVFLSKIEQHFDKLRETFWKISSNLRKALSMVVHASTVVNANVSSIWLGICQILFFSLLYYTETLSSLIYKTRSNTVNFRLCALPPSSLISPPPVIGPSKGKQKNASAYEWVKYCFCHEKIKFISSRCRVMFFLLYRQKDIDKIIDFYSPKSNFKFTVQQYKTLLQ